MATYVPTLNAEDLNPERKRSHNRVRTYRAIIPTIELARLRQRVEEATDSWLVREIIHFANGTTEVEFIYGPVHGNWPSDVQRLLQEAGCQIIGKIRSAGKPQHVTDGSCKHYNCVK